MKTKFMSMVLTVAMAVSSAATMVHATDYGSGYQNEPTGTYYQIFNDVPSSHWAFSYIGAMVQRGVLDGYPDGNFYPDNTVTRAEFAKIMIGAAKMPVYQPAYKYFQDVETTAWYAPYVHSAYPFLSGYDYGTNNRYYMPDEPAVREDIAVALVKLKGYEDDYADTSILSTMFTDVSSISLDARPYVAIAVERGLVSGYDDRTFRGQASITRAEAAAMLWRAYQYGNDNKVFDDEYYENGNNYYDDDHEYTESPSVRPTSTPTATPTPRPTETPTPKPTPTLDPTPTPEPPRPYEMDTITKANVASMTYDNDDNVYYYDKSDNMVYMIDMDSERVSDVIDVGELTMRDDYKFDHEVEDMPESEPTEEVMDGDEEVKETEASEESDDEPEPDDPIEHYLDFNVERLCYDKQNERLLLKGNFQYITDWQRPDEKFNADVDTIYLDITNSDEPILYTVEIMSFNGSLIASTNDSEYSIEYSYDNNYEANDYNDYSINGRLVRYSYNSRKWVNVTDRELPRFSECALNTNGDLYYFWDGVSGGMFTCDLDGVVRNLEIQSKDDIYIADKTDWPYSYHGSSSHVNHFHPCNNGKFVFYDTEAQAIRVIRER